MLKDTGERCFNRKARNAAGVLKVPLEMKLLCTLRALGSGLSFECAADITGDISSVACREFFLNFVHFFRKHYEEALMKVPTGAQIIRVMTIHEKIGLPGMIGSIDAVFVNHHMGGKHLKNVSSGDKGKGYLYQAVVDHTRYCMSFEGGFFATTNGKTSVRCNKFVEGLDHHTSDRDEMVVKERVMTHLLLMIDFFFVVTTVGKRTVKKKKKVFSPQIICKIIY